MTKKEESPDNITSTIILVKVLKSLASIKVTVLCLMVLLLLVVWGTLFQADHGLYQAQQKFFHSWFFLIAGVIPFPGTILVMFALSVNLVFSIIYRIGFRLSNIGNLITHLGLIFLLAGSFIIYLESEESYLRIREGQEINASVSQTHWEIAVWKEESSRTQVYAFDSDNLQANEKISLEELGIAVKIKQYYKHCRPSREYENSSSGLLNYSGLRGLVAVSDQTEPGGHVAGCIMQVYSSGGRPQQVLLYGRDAGATPVDVNNQTFYLSLRNKRLPLPFSLKLLDFKRVIYPNSNIPKSFESRVTLKTPDGLERDVIISMNNPLRFEDITIFQSSYEIAGDGTESTILAVVKSSFRLFPYFSSIFIFLGLVLHFIIMLTRNRKRPAE